MKRQYMAIAIALLLIASIVPAIVLATEDGEAVQISADTAITTNSSNMSGKMRLDTRRIMEQREQDRDALQARINQTRLDIKNITKQREEMMKDAREDMKVRMLEMREITKDRMEKAREMMQEQKERLEELRDQFKQKREDFKEARDDWKQECRAENKTTNQSCNVAKQKLNDHAKQFMGNAAEQILRLIATTKTKIDVNPNIDADTATTVIATLDARAAAVTAAQVKIDALKNSSDVNATKAAAAELQTAWKQARITIRLADGLLAHAKFQQTLDNLGKMKTRFTESSDRLKADGKDVTQLDADIDAFGAKIDAATTSYVNARDAYVDAMATVKTEAEAETLINSTKEQLKAVQESLKGARDDLRNIIKDIKTLNAAELTTVAAAVTVDQQTEVST